MNRPARRRAAALLVLAIVGVIAPWAAGVAAADPAVDRAAVPADYQSLVDDQATALCMGRTATDAGPCGDDTAAMWRAATTCAPADPSADGDGPTRAEQATFMACMAEAGFGEKDPETADPDAAESADGLGTLTLGKLSASLTAFYVNALSPTATGSTTSTGLGAWAGVLSSPAMAGGFVGALDVSAGQSTEWLFGRGNAANTAEIQYRAFDRIVPSETLVGEGPVSGADPDVGTQAYLAYGATLAGLGLDTALNKDNGLSGLLNAPGPRGYVLLLMYMGTGFLDTVFDSVLEALTFLNPFRFMVEAITGDYGDNAAGDLADPVDNEPDGAFSGLRDAFGQIYHVLLNIGWMLVVPVLLISLLFGAVFLKQANTSSKAKKFVIVVVFLAVGLPVLGGLYTAALTSMASTNADSARGASTKIVLSTLVDFESWVSNSRLSPPGGQSLTWDLDKHSPTSTSEAAARVSALEINATNNPAFASLRENRAVTAFSGAGFDYSWGSQIAGNRQQNLDGTNTTGGTVPVSEALTGFSATRDLLMRYARGSTVSASGYESQVKGVLTRLAEQGGEQDVLKWFGELANPESLANLEVKDVAALRNPLAQIDNTYGGLKGYRDGDVWSFHAGEENPACAIGTGGDGGLVPAKWTPGSRNNLLIPCNMSILAMYNYLNTSFGPASMETFSPEQTMNAYSRTNHASVTAVGAGPAGLLYFFSAMSVLGSFVTIGFGYALGMMFSSIKRGFHLMGAVLASSVGLIAGVAKVVVYTAALLLELLGTLFLYKLVQEVIMAVPALLEKPLTSRFNQPDGLVNLESSTNLGIAALLVTVVSTIGIVVFTGLAMKLRRGLLDSIDQLVTNAVNKFTETQVGAGMAPGQPGAWRQGLSRGAMMGAQTLVMGGLAGNSTSHDTSNATRTVTAGDVGESSGDGDAELVGSTGTPSNAPVATGPDGADGVNGDGSMSVGPDGGMRDAAGNPVVRQSGSLMSLDSLVPIDPQSGHVLDDQGNAVIGSDGSPVGREDVAGFDADGTMLDAQGAPLTDASGEPLTSASARAASGHLMGPEALAARVASQGLSPALSTNPLTGAPVDAPAPVPVPSVPTAPKRLGEVPTATHAMGDDAPSVTKTAAASAAVSVLGSKLSGQRQPKNWLATTEGKR